MKKKSNFWTKVSQPILALAPMAGFTDIAFREVCADFGADVVYSEMASAAALYYSSDFSLANPTIDLLRKGRGDCRVKYVVQLFGSQPEHFARAAQIVTEQIKPDGLDINLGCPVSKVLKQGAGSDLMKNILLAREVIAATLASTHLPVSIKIRSNSGGVGAIEFLDRINDLAITAVMIHGRSVSQGFSGEIDYQLIKEARRHFDGIILANGGIDSLAQAQKTLQLSEADGLGLARGALARPYLFSEIKNKQVDERSESEILGLIAKHAALVYEYKGDRGLVDLRKHLCWYVQGLPGASRLRARFIKISSYQELQDLLEELKSNFN